MSDFGARMRELGGLLWRKARQGGEAAAEALEQQASIQRLVGQIRKLQRERAQLFSQIGTKVYALHGQSKVRNQDVLVDCERLDAIGQEIDRLRRQIEDIRTASLAQGVQLPEISDDTALTAEGSATGDVTPAAVAPVVASVAVSEAADNDYVPPEQESAPDSCAPVDDDEPGAEEAEK